MIIMIYYLQWPIMFESLLLLSYLQITRKLVNNDGGVRVTRYLVLCICFVCPFSFGHYVVFTDSGIFTLFLQYWIKSHKLKHLSQTNGIIPLYNIYSTYIEIRLVVTIPRDIYKNIIFPSQQHHISLSTISYFPYSKFSRFNALGHITVFHVSKDNSRDVPK